MDILEKLITEVYDNRQSYKQNDYITICNLLKESYDKLKGNPLINLNDKGYTFDNNGPTVFQSSRATHDEVADDEPSSPPPVDGTTAEEADSWSYSDSYLGHHDGYYEPLGLGHGDLSDGYLSDGY